MNPRADHTTATAGSTFLDAEDVALLVDQYELTMLQAYWAQEMHESAHFSLFARRLPEGRNYFLACGLDTVLGLLEGFGFSEEARRHLKSMGVFDPEFVDWLADLRFTGDVRAVPEGTPVFPDEPFLEVEASLPEAQILETLVMNQLHLQTVLASKAVRVKWAAGERSVVDFGLRRMHGTDAGLHSARAFHVAGIDATSNVLAGKVFGVPVTGTMAHSYIQAHDDELESFRAFARSFPETILLVDTYDTLDGVRKVVRLAEEVGDDFQVQGVRLDSGDLGELARGSRRILDEAGLEDLDIFASGGLDEWEIWNLVSEGAPIDGFGVGTGMGVAEDAPALDIAYKLTGYAGKGRLKLSSGKDILPGPKQVFRQEGEQGRAIRDIIGRADESLPGRPLLRKVMEDGTRLPAGAEPLDALRERTVQQVGKLPRRIQALESADPPYEVAISAKLERYTEEVIQRVAEAAKGDAA